MDRERIAMANIALTATCNRSCAFCFATDAMESHAPRSEFMTLEKFDEALDFLKRSNIGEARLLGGEPTIHPQFEAIVDRVEARGLRLVLFTGGMIPEKALRRLERLAPGQLAVLLNVIPPTEPPAQLRRQQDVLKALGPCIVPGVTIDTPAVDIWYLVELIEEYGLARAVRLGLAHPSLGGANRHVHPRHYPEVGARVAAFGMAAQQRGIRLEFDCGWVPCMFPEGALAALGKTSNDVGLRCNPILDLMPDGQMISCYPLASHSDITLTDAHDANAMRQQFENRQRSDRTFMLYRECDECAWRARGECTGGCLSASLGRLRRRDFAITVPEAAGA
jgi:radical SAM protein with 4Fe4S-binding SPASM domain